MRGLNQSEHKVKEICCPMCFIMAVISFLVYFGKINKIEKINSLNFAESNERCKTNARSSFERQDFLLFSLIYTCILVAMHT